MNENTKIKRYTAKISHMSIMSVYAKSRAEAEAEIEDQLNRPGRRDILRQWNDFGRMIEEN